MRKRTSLEINRAVVFALVLREMRGRFGRVRMGVFWTLGEPLLHLLVFSVVMSALRGRTMAGYDYPVFLVVALGPFILFRNIATALMGCIEANRGLFAYKQITPLDTFIARASVEIFLAAIVYALIMLGFGWWGYDVSVARPLEWLAVLALGMLLSLGLGIVFAIIVQALPEAKVVIRMAFMPLYFLSGVVLPPSNFPPEMLKYLLWNPYLHLTELIRSFVFFYYVPVDGVSAQFVVEFVVILLAIAFSLYRIRRIRLLAI